MPGRSGYDLCASIRVRSGAARGAGSDPRLQPAALRRGAGAARPGRPATSPSPGRRTRSSTRCVRPAAAPAALPRGRGRAGRRRPTPPRSGWPLRCPRPRSRRRVRRDQHRQQPGHRRFPGPGGDAPARRCAEPRRDPAAASGWRRRPRPPGRCRCRRCRRSPAAAGQLARDAAVAHPGHAAGRDAARPARDGAGAPHRRSGPGRRAAGAPRRRRRRWAAR